MMRILEIVRTWLLGFLGIHEICVLKGNEPFRRIAQELLGMHRVFGNSENLIIGQGVVLNDAVINTVSGLVVFKDYAFCGHGVSILTGTHDYQHTGLSRQLNVPCMGRDILVEEGVWIGSNVTVLGPCTIGQNAVIAAGSVVTGNVEANCVYGGVPARKIKPIHFTQPPQ